MKTFYLALAILSFIVLLVFVNAFTVSGITQKMLTLTDLLPSAQEAVADEFETAEKTAGEIYSIWQKYENLIGLSVNYEYIFNIDSAANELLGYIAAKDDAEYNAAVSRLRSRITRLKEAESFSIHNIT